MLVKTCPAVGIRAARQEKKSSFSCYRVNEFLAYFIFRRKNLDLRYHSAVPVFPSVNCKIFDSFFFTIYNINVMPLRHVFKLHILNINRMGDSQIVDL
jgi:hypothetical protein